MFAGSKLFLTTGFLPLFHAYTKIRKNIKALRFTLNIVEKRKHTTAETQTIRASVILPRRPFVNNVKSSKKTEDEVVSVCF